MAMPSAMKLCNKFGGAHPAMSSAAPHFHIPQERLRSQNKCANMVGHAGVDESSDKENSPRAELATDMTKFAETENPKETAQMAEAEQLAEKEVSAETEQPTETKNLMTLEGIPAEECYIKLKPDTTRWLTWSNDPQDLMLHTAFRTNKPNLANDFGIDRLLPVVRDAPDTSDIFIIHDLNKSYYVWEEMDGQLLKVRDEFITGDDLESIDDVVLNIVENICAVTDSALPVPWAGEADNARLCSPMVSQVT